MSADLLEAFGGHPNDKSGSQETPGSNLVASGSPPRSNNISEPHETWQPWPSIAGNVIQSSSHFQSQKLWETDDEGKNVLFDAGEFDSERFSVHGDEFGDFEQVETEIQHNVPDVETHLTSTNLLDLDGTSTQITRDANAKFQPAVPITSHDQVKGFVHYPHIVPIENTLPSLPCETEDEWGDFETIEKQGFSPNPGLKDPSSTLPEPISSKPRIYQKVLNDAPARIASTKLVDPNVIEKSFEEVEDDEWDDFEDGNRNDEGQSTTSVSATLAQQSSVKATGTEENTSQDRPTNMPPPAVLLGWLQKVFSALAAQARRSNTDHRTGFVTAQSYRVCARIIAGRALRWKRDTILAQSMRIGAAGRSGGMKLAALDKGESRKEDQAAEEVIASWTRVSYVLNAAMTKAKVPKPPMSLSNKLSARPATGLDVINATLACSACGLRRNERVIGIDINVSDTFGEFWIEHWGHRDCADVWYQFNEMLDRR